MDQGLIKIRQTILRRHGGRSGANTRRILSLGAREEQMRQRITPFS
jgi:hypothetical protein